MRVNRFIVLLVGLLFICLSAGAQSTIPLKKSGESYSGRAAKSERSKMIGTKMDVNSLPIMPNTNYSDERFKELDKQMQEREWNNEDTAWKRASSLDTKEAYQTYVARYPYGAHRGQADQRLIDLKVNDVFNGDHGQLPGMTLIESNENSPTSIIVVQNHTSLPLTVMYSGNDSRSVTIMPGQKQTVVIKNGYYRIAASVPDVHVRPFAGEENFSGGRYEAGYHIVSIGN